MIRRALELRYGASLTPQMVVPEREVDFSATITYSEEGNNQGWDFLEGAALGDVGATGGPTQDLLRGSFSASFGRHPEEADRELSFVSNGANWEYDVERPDPDPGGGPIEMEPAGMVVDPDGTGGTEVTITLANDTAGVY